MYYRFLYCLLSILSAFLYAASSYAQNSKREARLDSLIKVNTTYHKQDSIKADNFGDIASMYSQQSDYPEALEYYKKGAELAMLLNDKPRMIRFFGNMGVEYTAMANYPKALECHQKALLFSEQLGHRGLMSFNQNSIGRVYMFLGDYPKALTNYEKALALSEELGLKGAIARQLRNIGNTYNKMGDYPKALDYLQRSQKLFETLGNEEGEAIGLGVIGSVYLSLSEYEKAMEFQQRALKMNRNSGNKRQQSMNLLNIGKIYREAPDASLQKMGIKPEDRYSKTLEYLNLGQDLAKQISDPGTEKTAWEDLSYTYEKKGDYANAYLAYKHFIVLRDSIEGTEIKNTMELKEMQFDFDKKETAFKFQQQLTEEKLQKHKLLTIQQQQEINLKQQALILSHKEKELQHLEYLKTQAELHRQKIVAENQLALNEKKDAELKLLNKERDLQEAELELTTAELSAKEFQRNGFIVGTVLLLLLAGTIFTGLQRTSKEKKKSEDLLLNILPAEVAHELKQSGEAIAKQYNHVTVLFTDFVNFTTISEQLSPTELVAEIHKNFTAFDSIIEKHGLEKIKTIGDAYLAVCGLPNETTDHAQRTLKAALDIQTHMNASKGKFQVRMGINSGAVVAGIVGVKKYAYDIWGDTVNTAARMEQYSEAGKINISQSTYELVKDTFICEYRGKMEAKNKGEVDMYFVSDEKRDK